MGGWRFMRHREDRQLPNDISVYQKVQQSIMDNIQESDVRRRFPLCSVVEERSRSERGVRRLIDD